MQKKVFFQNNSGQKLAGILHIPSKIPAPAVIMCHGFRSSKANKVPWCEFFRKRGFIAFRFDFNGHGESYGDFRDFTITKCIGDLGAAIRFMKSQKFLKNRIGITGHSLGGQIIMIYAAKNNAHAINPVSAPFRLEDTDIMKDKNVMEKWKEKGIRHFYVRAKRKKEKKPLSYNFVSDSMKYDMELLSGKIRCPSLIMHGSRDEKVALSHAKLYYKNINAPKKLIILKGARHKIERERDLKILYQETAKWFGKYLK